MIPEGWNRYRAWAKRARTLQAASERDKFLALIAAIVAALFGALAITIPSDWSFLAKGAAILAGFSAAVTPILGRDFLNAGHEKGWILARATAEAIKSECFLLAASAAPYSGPNAAALFSVRLDGLEHNALAERLTPLIDPAKEDRRRPAGPDGPTPMNLDWYRSERIAEQYVYYQTRYEAHERATKRLRFASLGMAVLGAMFGTVATAGVIGFAPWIGFLTTVSATVAAWGYMERRSTLAATYGMMAYRLGALHDRAAATPRSLAEIVTETEDLLRAEHAGWLSEMQRTPAAPSAPTAGGEGAPTRDADGEPMPPLRDGPK